MTHITTATVKHVDPQPVTRTAAWWLVLLATEGGGFVTVATWNDRAASLCKESMGNRWTKPFPVKVAYVETPPYGHKLIRVEPLEKAGAA